MSKSEMSAYAHELADVLTAGEHALGPTDSDLCAFSRRFLARPTCSRLFPSIHSPPQTTAFRNVGDYEIAKVAAYREHRDFYLQMTKVIRELLTQITPVAQSVRA